jgi:hypothetical protein
MHPYPEAIALLAKCSAGPAGTSITRAPSLAMRYQRQKRPVAPSKDIGVVIFSGKLARYMSDIDILTATVDTAN